jgi:hypothetical protein
VTPPRLEIIGRRLLEQTRAAEIEWHVTNNRLYGHPAYACETVDGTVIVDTCPGGVSLRLVDGGQDVDRADGSMSSWVAVPDKNGFCDAASLLRENLIHPPGPPYSEGFPAVLDELWERTKNEAAEG